MFSNLRLGSSVYILLKGEPPILKIGQVTLINNNLYGYTTSLTCDITVKVGDSSTDFKQLPGLMLLAIYDNGNVIISDSRELMSDEVTKLISTSKQVLESIPYHEKVVSECELMLKELNPLYAKLKLLEELISNLELKVVGIEDKLDNIVNMLSKTLTK